jgi:hypothetical protein
LAAGLFYVGGPELAGQFLKKQRLAPLRGYAIAFGSGKTDLSRTKNMSKWRAKALDLFPDMRAEIQSAESVGGFWITLMSRFHGHYRSEIHDEPRQSPTLIRATCLYAVWCDRSESPGTQEAARIEFYEYLPSFALQCTRLNCQRLVGDLVANLGTEEIARMGVSLGPVDLDRFLAEVRRADGDRRRRSQKR